MNDEPKDISKKVAKTRQVAETALKELIAEGKKVSQHAVEKRAGLSNGALNYKHPEYIDLKNRIAEVQRAASPKPKRSADDRKIIQIQTRLKEKYRSQRDEYKEQLKAALGKTLEAKYQLFQLQRLFAHHEGKNSLYGNVVDITKGKH